jgi:hypothetical protein
VPLGRVDTSYRAVGWVRGDPFPGAEPGKLARGTEYRVAGNGGSGASLELCTVTPGGRPSYIPAYLVIDVWGALGGIGGPRGSGSCLAAGWMIDALSVLLLRLVYLVSTW